MAHVSTPLTWSLDSTASTTISVFKDVMRAATSDNVQPLALMACEKFGATLAMCPETNKKMEDLIIKVSGPKHVRFMRAQIGYSANDSATQLSRSLAGIQFLGLAAALNSSVAMFEGANVLSEMLMDSASDKTLLPTTRQLKDLLVVMEHRLVRSGFADTWVGYRILLSAGLRASSDQDCWKPPDDWADLMAIPKSDGISNLVKAFRQLNRLGDATAITIRATSCAPWVMAFTRWCLGIPPSTILPEGKALLDQPASRITVFIDKDARLDALEISVQRSIDGPADLLKSHPALPNPCGMITVECFGQMMCHEMGGKGSMAYAAVCEALPYALKQSRELLQVFSSTVELVTDNLNETTEMADEVAEKKAEKNAEDTAARKDATKREQDAKYRSQPFPDDSTISSTLTRVLKFESNQYLHRLNDGQRISDLPLVRKHLHELAIGCRCHIRQKRAMKPHGEDHSTESCDLVDRFWRNISLYAAYILTLSLFEYPETLLVSFRPCHPFRGLPNAVYEVIQSARPTLCAIEEILACAQRLVGHKPLRDDDGWVISSEKGQAVYPRVYQTGDICQPGYLVLCWAPGLLFFDGEVYDRGFAGLRLASHEYATDPLLSRPPPVTEPLNLLPKIKMEWKVVRQDGYLEIYLVCGGSVGLASRILYNLSHALILRGCPHDRASPLENPDLLSSYISPTTARISSVTKGQIGVVAVDGDAGLRMFALSNWNSVAKSSVIRDNACLQCCLDLCRRAGYGRVIC